ncbi:MAG: hypothetical protein AAGH64_03120 [Planctomycetota bacterium]
MHTRTTALASFIAVFAIVGIALVLAQPSLTPPPGPIDESGRFGTRIEVNDDTAPGDGTFRHIISAPGSYVLTGDVRSGFGNGIRIDTDNVTLDLNGYTVIGAGFEGISVRETPLFGSREVRGVTVKNGRIVGYQTGIEADRILLPDAVSFSGARLSDLEIRATEVGISARLATIERCIVTAEDLGIGLAEGTVRDTSVRMVGTNVEALGVFLRDSKATDCEVNMSGLPCCLTIAFLAFESHLVECTAVRSSGLDFDISLSSLAIGCRSSSDFNFVGSDSQIIDCDFVSN